MHRAQLSLRPLTALGLILSMSCGEQVVVRETQAACGNELIEREEQCDDGNQDAADSCTDGCKTAICGDAILRADLELGDEGYEACDDGNASDEDGCLSTCVIASCGDGILRTDLAETDLGFEACDDGNTNANEHYTDTPFSNEEWGSLLPELWRILKPGGHILIFCDEGQYDFISPNVNSITSFCQT